MATVDLEQLEEEIASFGSVMTSDVDGDWLDVELEVTKFRVHRDGFICENDGTDMTGIILSLARAVSPSAPEWLRDRIRDAAWSAYWGEGKRECPSSGHIVWGDVADAVLAVLPPPAPRVDEITIPRELAERAVEAFEYVSAAEANHDNYQGSNLSLEYRNTLTAMLEGTA